MQIAAITEIITQFIGLFHLDEDPDRAWAHPEGSGAQSQVFIVPSEFRVPAHSLSDEPAPSSEPVPFTSIPASSDVFLHAWRSSPIASPHARNVPHGPLDLFQQPLPIVDTGAGGGGSGEASAGGTSPIWHGADETVVDVHQVNMLNADTSYVDNPTGAPLTFASDASITAMIDQAYAPIPASAPVLGQSDAVEVQAVKGFEDTLGLGSTPQVDTLTQGTWVDGAKVSGDGNPVALSLPVQNLDLSAPTGGNVPLGQTIITGGDIAGNVALINDTSGAHLTTIVEGNAYDANLIVQSNVIQNLDAIATNLPGAFAVASTNGDTATNTAHFEQAPVSSIASGHLGQQWNVQVNNGDFYDINATTQQNVLINDALYVGAPSTEHYYAVLGGNTQVNQFDYSHNAPIYDLLIVLGNSYTTNAIYQENVLLNNATAGIAFAENGNGDTITAGHDTVSNDAAIAQSGTTNWEQPTANLQSLVHSLSMHGNAAAAFPGINSVGATVNVMIVTGNYYNINLISQTNVVTNSSDVLADLTKAGLGTPAAVVTGQDNLSNSAAIVSAGALNSQYAAGHHYETSMLVQANMITAHTDVSAGSPNALVPELVAFLDNGDAQTNPSHGPSLSTAEAPQHDVLAGGLA